MFNGWMSYYSIKPEVKNKIDYKITFFMKKSSEKTVEKTTQKIIELIKINPNISRREIAEKLDNITEDGVKYNLNKLVKEKRVKRVGPDKGGYWQILR